MQRRKMRRRLAKAGTDEEQIPGRDQAVMLLIGGMSMDAVRAQLMTRQGFDVNRANAALAHARKKITLAADYARDEQLGKAIRRLEDLYAKAVSAHDPGTALQIQREINKLIGLYRSPAAEIVTPAQDAKGQLSLIAEYVLPLKLVADSYPLEEHVRVACEIVRSSRNIPPPR